MSRDDGFVVADVATGLYEDDKVKRLYRELNGDLGRMGHAMMLCEATLLASWRDGRRLTIHEAAPLWLTVDEALVAVLVKVGLLDRSHRRPLRSWNNWFGPAWDRREVRRRSGALGGLRQRGKRSQSDAIAELQRRSSDATPVRPSGRTVRGASSKHPSRARAREASSNDATERAAASAREVVASLGFGRR